MLVGRGREWDELFTVVGAAREGKGRALVLHGPPGVGKSALLTGVTETCAPGMRALRATGMEGEAGLPFAALHQLLRPLLPGLGELPRPQADALCGAFGMSAVRADRFLVGLATLSLLSNASAGTPLLITVDDAHWLDPASAEALVFLARRLESEAVALLLATRNDAGLFPLPGVPDLQILPLNDADAAGLLARTLPKTVPTVRKRLLREARGHPLALVELPAALSPCHLDGTTPLPDPLPLGERQRKFFHDPAAGLTDVQRDVLLLAAAAGDAEPSTVLRACADADAARDALFEAVSTGVIRLDQREVTFRHPLARSAVYHGASFRRRRAAHLALARSLAPDDDRRGLAPGRGFRGPGRRGGPAADRAGRTRPAQRGSGDRRAGAAPGGGAGLRTPGAGPPAGGGGRVRLDDRGHLARRDPAQAGGGAGRRPADACQGAGAARRDDTRRW
ncbi:AAA family ATPase [Streptomyces cacaoi]